MSSPRVLALAFALMACTPAPEPPAPRLKAGVCEMRVNPKVFLGEQITFETRIEADGRHLSLLMGVPCEKGLRYSYADSVPKSTQEAITKAIFAPWPGTRGKRIYARFTGTLRPVPDEQQLFPYYFEISAVDDLKVEIGERPW